MAVVVVLVGAVAAGTVLWRGSALPEGAVFELDGRTYDESDLRQYVREQQALYGLEVPDLTDDDERRTAAQSFAASLIVDGAADQRGEPVTQEEVDAAAEQFFRAAYPGGRAEFVDALADEGVSEADVLEEIRRQLAVEQLYNEVTADLSVEADEVRAAYVANPEDFVLPETRRVAAIAVGDRAEALRLRRTLDASNFAAVARRRSLDTTTAPDGGDLGFLSAEQLQGPFAEAAFAAEEGVVFGPVRAPEADYVYLGIVRAVRPGRNQDFEEVREELRDTLLAARALTTWQAFLSDLVFEADLVYADDYRPDDTTSLPRFDLPGSEPSSAPSGSPDAEQ